MCCDVSNGIRNGLQTCYPFIEISPNPLKIATSTIASRAIGEVLAEINSLTKGLKTTQWKPEHMFNDKNDPNHQKIHEKISTAIPKILNEYDFDSIKGYNLTKDELQIVGQPIAQKVIEEFNKKIPGNTHLHSGMHFSVGQKTTRLTLQIKRNWMII